MAFPLGVPGPTPRDLAKDSWKSHRLPAIQGFGGIPADDRMTLKYGGPPFENAFSWAVYNHSFTRVYLVAISYNELVRWGYKPTYNIL